MVPLSFKDATTLSIMTLSKITFSIITQHKVLIYYTLHKCNSAWMTLSITIPCHYAECFILVFVMLNVIMLSVIMVNVFVLSVITLNEIVLSAPNKDRCEYLQKSNLIARYVANTHPWACLQKVGNCDISVKWKILVINNEMRQNFVKTKS